jgi:Na+-translocating ferredoxin:NAD+ oxidoreductase RnfC subunit
VVLTHAESRAARDAPLHPCGRCLDACPVFLVPQQLGALAQAGRYEEMEELEPGDCMLCGSCSYVCPSQHPAVADVRAQQGRAAPAEGEGRMNARPAGELTAAPHLQAPDSTARIMWTVVATLCPIVAAAVWFFGISALLVIGAATPARSAPSG